MSDVHDYYEEKLNRMSEVMQKAMYGLEQQMSQHIRAEKEIMQDMIAEIKNGAKQKI